MHSNGSPVKQQRLGAIVLLATAIITLAGVALMWIVSPRVPYADQWLFYRHLIERPFAEVVLAADNGHREILPKLVRMAELKAFGADQNLQITLGMLFALATFSLLALTHWRAPLPFAQRCAGMLVAALGIFWLGNERALAHSNDAVHAYLVTFFMAAALTLVARDSPASEIPRSLAASLCALAATFTFGSGVAVWPALLLVLALRRASLRAWLPFAGGLLLALVLYLGGARAATTTTLSFDPFAQGLLLLRWLAAPFVYVFWPLLDAGIAAQLPAGIGRDISSEIALAWTSAFGTTAQSTWPLAAFGVAGVSMFCVLCWRVWRAHDVEEVAVRVALGVAGFALGVGAVIALSRANYFAVHPDQVQATRYLVWSSLFWCGLGMAFVLRMATPHAAAVFALVLAIIVAPSEIWMGRLAANMRTVADRAALGGAVRVLDRAEPLGETRFEELACLLPLFEQRRLAMYAWPETHWLGRRPPAAAVHAIAADEVRVEVIDNRFDGDGARIVLRAPAAVHALIIVLDASGYAIGLAQRDPPYAGDTYRGWIRGTPAAATLSFAQRID